LTGRQQPQRLREVRVEDLLGRDPVQLDRTVVGKNLEGRCVLVTGAGGSIGSELVRQIARYRPSRLILVDAAETPLFEINNELAEMAPDLDRVCIIADIKHADLVDKIFEEHKPHRVFHAAAYKHVPLMEAHPVEAVFNNIFGTRAVARAAVEHKAESFVMISTDKAVRPTSIMGATKRCAELIVALMNGCGTRFITVRFGNVLGSTGSVVPIFRKQIAKGGPVRVTHPDVTRFFMTIPEAVELVLQAGSIGEGGEVFILDMGEPVKIVDLARSMVELSGYELGTDIGIEFTGLRPGEKLYEELVAYGEDVQPTSIPKVMVHRVPHSRLDEDELAGQMKQLEKAAMDCDDAVTISMLWEIVQGHDPDVVMNHDNKLAGVSSRVSA
jgi:FlaA1/EpsC-like NDP-sugar epimerase